MLAQRLEFVPANDAEIFAAVPAAPAVFLLHGGDAQAEPYISKTANLRRRLQRLLGAPTELSKRLNLRERVRWIEYSPTGSDFESGFLIYKLATHRFPEDVHRAPAFALRSAGQVAHGERISAGLDHYAAGPANGRSLYYGPFASRTAAEKFANDSLDFFKMRRCVEDLHPDPRFPGCIYSEMKMCLAPCFKGCTDEEYRAEVGRVRAYFDSGGESLLREISNQRDEALEPTSNSKMQPRCTRASEKSSIRWLANFRRSFVESIIWRA